MDKTFLESYFKDLSELIIPDDKTVEKLECIFSNGSQKNKTDNDFLRKSIRNILV